MNRISKILIFAGMALLIVQAGVGKVTAQNRDVESVEDAIRQLRSLQMQRDFEAGYMLGKELIQEYPESVELKAWFIANMARNDLAGEATEKAEALIEKYPDNPWSHFALVRALNSHGDRGKEALEIVDKVVEMNPGHPDFLWMKASVLYSQESKEAAIEFIDEVVPRVKNPAEILTTKGNGLLSLARSAEGESSDSLFNKGLAVFEQVRELDPGCSDAWYLPGYYHMIANRFEKAYPLMKEAAETSTALRIHSGYWRTIMGYDGLPMEKKEQLILSDMESLQQRRVETPQMLFYMANQYGELGLEDKKREYEKMVLQKYPEDVYAEWVLVNRYRNFSREHGKEIAEGNEKLEKQYKKLLWDFLDRPTHNRMTLVGDAYRNLYFVARDDSTISPDTLLQIVNGMVEHEGINPHITHAGGARTLAEHNVYFDRARKIAREGVELAEEKINAQNERGSYDTEEEYRKSLGWYTGLMYDALGWVYFHEGKLDSAEKYLSKAHSLDPDNRETLYHLGKLQQKKGNLAKAEDYFVKGYGIKGSGTNPNRSALEMLYIERNGSPEGFESFLTSLNEETSEKRKQKVLAGRIDNPEAMASFKLDNLSGESYSSENLKGKIAVINIWGIWCGPCVREMPDIQKLHEKYKDDPNVIVLTINNDPSIEKVREWMKEREFTFPVLRDNGYLSEQGVHVFPTTWFLDKETRISYIKEGYTEPLVEEFSWRVEDLMDP